ncbi:MAG: hypothetical protein EOP24_25670 [Hyphomicrobiales bacterium]|nr:MAG: hypothetical protein EOP24_25670 [Hyphomicrobiales bacterium]
MCPRHGTSAPQSGHGTDDCDDESLISVLARIASSARRLTLHLPRDWPWEAEWTPLFASTRRRKPQATWSAGHLRPPRATSGPDPKPSGTTRHTGRAITHAPIASPAQLFSVMTMLGASGCGTRVSPNYCAGSTLSPTHVPPAWSNAESGKWGDQRAGHPLLARCRCSLIVTTHRSILQARPRQLNELFIITIVMRSSTPPLL